MGMSIWATVAALLSHLSLTDVTGTSSIDRDLKIEVFLVSRKPRGSKSHLTAILPSRLTFVVLGFNGKYRPSGK